MIICGVGVGNLSAITLVNAAKRNRVSERQRTIRKNTKKSEEQWVDNNGDCHSKQRAARVYIQWNYNDIIKKHHSHARKDENCQMPIDNSEVG